jgi:hypothetical protein
LIEALKKGSIILGFYAKIGMKAVYAVVLISILTSVLLVFTFPTAKSAYTGVAKLKEFYFHYVDTPVAAGGTETKYVMNTTRQFEFLTQQEAYENSFYKPIGLPKIVIDFYLYPNFAGPVRLDGTWQVFIWVNGSAYKPAGFVLNFREITVGGNVLWDSGTITPEVTSNIGEYIDVPVSNYNLSAPLTHVFNPGTTLLVEVEVNAGSSAETRIWYNSPLYPSKAILPAQDYARPVTIKTYTVENHQTELFYYNWSESQRKVIVRTNVTDPFGGYDIYRVNMTILDPTGKPVQDNREMFRVSGGLWQFDYSHIFEATWPYQASALVGNYTVAVSVIDNNGNHQQSLTGSFNPFIEEETHVFTIGIIEYYDPVFLVTDDTGDPLPNAQIYLTWANGTKETYPRYTSTNGFINLTHVPVGDYAFTILWKDKIVQQATIHVDSNSVYTIKTQVYKLTMNILDKNGNPVHGAYVIAETVSGVGYGLDISDATGIVSFKLPSGDYQIEAHYTTDYWLTMVKTNGSTPVSVTESTTKDIILTGFPPAIWTTIGFILAVSSISIAVTAIAIFYLIYRRMH